MGYYIEYDKIPIRAENKGKKNYLKYFSVFVLLTAIAGLCMIPQLRRVAAAIVFPGIGNEGIHALDQLVNQLWNKEPIGDAFRNFCIQVFSSVNG